MAPKYQFFQQGKYNLWSKLLRPCRNKREWFWWNKVIPLIFKQFRSRDWSPKFVTGLNVIIGQNDSPMRESFWTVWSLIYFLYYSLLSYLAQSKFWWSVSRSHLSKLDWLTPQDIYLLASAVLTYKNSVGFLLIW